MIAKQRGFVIFFLKKKNKAKAGLFLFLFSNYLDILFENDGWFSPKWQFFQPKMGCLGVLSNNIGILGKILAKTCENMRIFEELFSYFSEYN